MRAPAPARAALLAAAVPAFLAGCGPLADNRVPAPDLRPPQVEAVQATGPGDIALRFDEEATLLPEKTVITPGLGVTGIAGTGRTVTVHVSPQTPGQPYVLETEAEDARGNSSRFLAAFYGWNGRVPGLLINELSPRGSGSHPDCTELRVMTAGNLGGVVLYCGTPGSFDARLIFPSCEVAAGSFIVVHWKPTGTGGEVDETADPAASGGFDASPTARDFWVPAGTGLPGNNGVVSLYERPGGRCLDGVLYSNRTSESDQRYRGFGEQAMLDRAEELLRDGGWSCEGAAVAPEDGVSPEGSTGTRSLCRMPGGSDTNRATDWHVVPTKKASFGAENCAEVYVP
jgi:hypothetical protein